MKTIFATYLGNGSLEARDKLDKQLLAENYDIGSVVKLKVTKPRSLKQLGYSFAILREVFDNLPEDCTPQFNDPEHLRAWTLYKSRRCTPMIMPRDEVSLASLRMLRRISGKHLFFEFHGPDVYIYEPDSIAVDKMEQDEFNDFLKDAKELYCELIPGLRMEDLDARVEETWNGE